MNLEKENNQDINLRIDDIEKEEYLEIKCELISLMRHILKMNDNQNALKCKIQFRKWLK